MGKRARDRYSLEPVLRLRRAERDARAREVAGALATVREREGDLEAALDAQREAHDRVDETRRTMAESARAGGRGRDLDLHARRIAFLESRAAAARSEVSSTRAVLDDARGELENRRDALARAISELKVVANHRERWELERARERERRQEEDP